MCFLLGSSSSWQVRFEEEPKARWTLPLLPCSQRGGIQLWQGYRITARGHYWLSDQDFTEFAYPPPTNILCWRIWGQVSKPCTVPVWQLYSDRSMELEGRQSTDCTSSQLSPALLNHLVTSHAKLTIVVMLLSLLPLACSSRNSSWRHPPPPMIPQHLGQPSL